MNIGLFDAQWLLRRNYHAILNNGSIEYRELISSFLSSVTKLSLACDITNPVLIFDKGPYLKEDYISLKSSRHYPSESDRIEVTEELSQDELDKIEKLNKDLDHRLACEGEFRHAKNLLIKFLPNIGIPVVAIKGYEADDLAYYIANLMGIQWDIKFITIDSDWEYLMSPRTTFYRQNSTHTVINYGSIVPPHGISLQVYGAIRCLINGNHNDVEMVKLDMDADTIAFHLSNNSLKEVIGEEKYNDFMMRLNALNCDTFFTEEVRKAIIESFEPMAKYKDDLDIRSFKQFHKIKTSFNFDKLIMNREVSTDPFSSILSKLPLKVLNHDTKE